LALKFKNSLTRAQIIDLSDNGARVRVETDPPRERTLDLEVFLPFHTDPLFAGRAQVIWSRHTSEGTEFGLEWTAPTAQAWQSAKNQLVNGI
jgi:hypothetical protein